MPLSWNSFLSNAGTASCLLMFPDNDQEISDGKKSGLLLQNFLWQSAQIPDSRKSTVPWNLSNTILRSALHTVMSAPHNPSQGTTLLSTPRPPCGFRLSPAQLHDFLFHQIQGKSQNEYPHWLQILLLLFLRHWRSPAVPNFRPLLPPAGSTGLTTTAVWAVDIEIFPVPVTKSFPSSLPSLLYAVRSIRLINALSSFFSKF